MDQYQNAASGLKQTFGGKLKQMVCVALLQTKILLIVWYLFFAGSTLFMVAICACFIGGIVFPAVCVVGLYKAGKDISACKKAAVICLLDIAAIVVRYIDEAGGRINLTYIVWGTLDSLRYGTWIGIIAAIIHYVALFLIAYLVCTSVAVVLEELGASKIAKTGQRVWEMQLAAGILFIAGLFSRSMIFYYLSYLSGVADIVASLLYLRFLYRSYRVLDTQDKESALDL